MMITNFSNLLDELKDGKTFSELCSNEMVECAGNEAYYDDDLIEYMASMGVGIEAFNNNYVTLYNVLNQRYYKIPYQDVENRFDIECGNETIIFFEYDKIKEVNMNGVIKTRPYANAICELFEELLEKYGIDIPDEDREGNDGEARIYGITYAELEDNVSDIIEQVLIERDQYNECEIDNYSY